MELNRANLQALFTGLNTKFQAGLTAADTVYGAYAMTVQSNTSQEAYAWMASLPGFREWIGDRVLNNIRTYDTTIKNKPWEDSITVKRTHIEDDQFGIYAPLAEMLGQAGAQHPQQLIDALILSGFNTNCYDGQYFFDVDHPVYDTNGNLQTVSNFQGGSGAAWFLIDDTKPVKPIVLQNRKSLKLTPMQSDQDEAVFMRNEFRYGADWRGNVGFGLWQLIYASKYSLGEDTFDAARLAMRTMVGDGGIKLNIQPKLCLVGPSNLSAAEKLFETATLPGGGDNQFYKAAKVVCSNWLQ